MSKLQEYCLNITDGEHGSIKDDPNGEYYFLNNNNITDDGIVINKSDRTMSKSDFEKIHRRTQLSKGDVVIASCGTIGKTQIITDDVINYDFSRSVGIIKCDTSKLLPEFLHFYFKNPLTQRRVVNASEGAVQKHFYIGAMSEFEVDIPDIPTQSSIVGLLSKIDAKISNNTSICSELESMAKFLYDYWFVQFDFPDENGKPYKSSGGKMVWNEELKREIPEGWEVAPLSELISISNNRISSEDIEDRKYVPIEVIPRKQMSFSKTACIEKAATGLCPFDENAILLSNRRVYFHKVCISPYRGVTRDTVIIINPKNKNNLGFVFQLVFSHHFIEYATRNSYGTEQPVLSPFTVMDYKIAYPSNELDIKYSAAVKDMVTKVLDIQRENQQLASLRDFLLPMLMNGQVSFKDN